MQSCTLLGGYILLLLLLLLCPERNNKEQETLPSPSAVAVSPVPVAGLSPAFSEEELSSILLAEASPSSFTSVFSFPSSGVYLHEHR